MIEVKNLYKIFGARPQRALEALKRGTGKEELLRQSGHDVGLRDICLTVEAGSIFVVMGLSGSGKSTLIRCLNRLIEPTAGEIIVDKVDILSLSRSRIREFRRRRMSMVFQHFGLLPHRTVLQNVAYGLELQGVERTRREANASQWIETVGLSGYQASYPEHLSGGMQQRVGLARALATDPDILLMDEAFSALDPLIRREMQDELIRLQEKLHKTIVFITHDLDEALRLGDRIGILKDGDMVQIGRREDILLNPADAYVRAFVQDVNRGRVLKAELVMTWPDAPTLEANDPTSALERIRGGVQDYAYVVDKDNRLLGVLTEAAAAREAERGAKNLNRAIERVPAVAPEAVLEEVLLQMLDSPWPVAVVDPVGALLGILPPARVLGALGGGT
jgi:glycine betaine/proline transport system ATP-binding protein